MRTHALAGATALVMLLLGLTATSATASRSLQATPSGSNSIAARPITFSDESGTFRIICEVRMRLSFNERIAKTSGALIANVTEASVTGCSGGEVRLLSPEAAAPWRLTYVSFTGTLPSITSARAALRGFSALITAFFGIARCLYADNPVLILRIIGLILDALVWIAIEPDPLQANLGGIECPANLTVNGTMPLRTSLRVSLV